MMVGQKVKKQVKLINRSPIDVSFTLLVTNTLLDPKVGIALAHTQTHTHTHSTRGLSNLSVSLCSRIYQSAQQVS